MTTAVLIGDDPWLAGRLAQLGLVVTPGTVALASDPEVVVVDLGGVDAVQQVGELRARWPLAILVGYLAVPDADRWLSAQRAGCDLVTNRGALPGRLRPLLRDGQARRARFPVASEADVAGRLGLVARVDESPVGPVAVYRIAGGFTACADRCPHQGARLSDGEVEGTTLTCPRHGSQFDVTTGDRTRGPADDGIAHHRVLLDEGQLFIVLDA